MKLASDEFYRLASYSMIIVSFILLIVFLRIFLISKESEHWEWWIALDVLVGVILILQVAWAADWFWI